MEDMMKDFLQLMEEAKESEHLCGEIWELLEHKSHHVQTAVVGALAYEMFMSMDEMKRRQMCCDMVTTLLELVMKGD